MKLARLFILSAICRNLILKMRLKRLFNKAHSGKLLQLKMISMRRCGRLP